LSINREDHCRRCWPVVAVSESIARPLSAIPLHWLVAVQVYRVAGGIALVLWADGRLPWQFARPAGIGKRCDGQRCRRRGCGTKCDWRPLGNIRLVCFRMKSTAHATPFFKALGAIGLQAQLDKSAALR
jgi:hypothetical protein